MSKLMCLSLDRTPAADMIEGTLAAWVEAVGTGRDWDEARDTPRIRRAFLTLAQTARRWPSVPEFVDALPKFESPKALPSAPADPARAQQMIAKVQAMLNPHIKAGPSPKVEKIDIAAVEADLRKNYADHRDRKTAAAGGDA